jgi:hypothetical protein
MVLNIPVSLYVTIDLFIHIFQRYAVFFRESNEVISMYPVLPARQAEGNQIAFFNPSQDGYLAYAAVSGDYSGGEILGVVNLDFCVHMTPPLLQ